MTTAETAYINQIREQLVTRRHNLETAITKHESAQITHLLHDVDQALAKLETGNFGVCQNCHESIEVDRVMADPLVTFCLGCLTPAQQRSLEQDLELAARMQIGLLPPDDSAVAGWETAFHFRPARVVSGDYFDIIGDDHGGMYFIMADVAGKGVGAAMLTASLRSVFRALIPTADCVGELLTRANRLFCESAMSGQYATLVFGHVNCDGALDVANAGHLPLLLAKGADLEVIESTDLPFGMFCSQQFTVQRTSLQPGDTLVLYTDGISEALNEAGEEFGVEQMREFVQSHGTKLPCEMVKNCRERLDGFRGNVERFDDETMLAIQFAPASKLSEPRHHAVM
ncbi:serine phosphatase [Candidatus Koribacter versatilis Ellin345]|uniref:Serine phosphatase n=1 Tax=Koribacter versatilis (strain Ellin345) TaxID=204669 RepID=Q1IQ14_KORVE|nr:SpoIIE family protein phosphatase [Candidatus Koribacter versatilis]ABF41036.1 serine phosphatase [Candidatus Koribacter versatilis Ellin345]